MSTRILLTEASNPNFTQMQDHATQRFVANGGDANSVKQGENDVTYSFNGHVYNLKLQGTDKVRATLDGKVVPTELDISDGGLPKTLTDLDREFAHFKQAM